MPATAKQAEERDKLTIYIPKSLLKQFKKHAIDLESDYSNLAELAFSEYLEKHQKLKR